jgi:hypothetical protein
MELLHQKTGRPSLLEFAAMLQEAGMSERAPLLGYCGNLEHAIARTWPDEHVRPYFARHADELRQMLASRKGFTVIQKMSAPDHLLALTTGVNRPAVYRAIGMIAAESGAIVDALFDIALGTVASERQLAQAVLGDVEGIEARIIDAMSAKKARTREAAAEWLARFNSTASPQI